MHGLFVRGGVTNSGFRQHPEVFQFSLEAGFCSASLARMETLRTTVGRSPCSNRFVDDVS